MTLFELWFSQGICPIMGLLGHMVVLFSVFSGISILFSIVAVSPSPGFIVCRFFDHGHSDWCEVIPHCSFDLHFSND